MDLATLPDIYRGCSPRSASTPGPAPDSPASGRFSASPLLSPCFAGYYTHPLYASASAFFNGWMMMQQQRPPIMAPPATSTTPSSRLAFSVENILKPEFGVPLASTPKNDHGMKRGPLDALMMTSLTVAPPPIKRPLEMLTSLGPAPIKRPYKAEVTSPATAAKRHQKSAVNIIKSDPSADDSSCSKSSSMADSSSGEASGSDAGGGGGGGGGKEETRAELPSDPSKMTDPAKWPAWIFCTRYSDRPSSGPRCRRVKKDRSPTAPKAAGSAEEKRPRTAFTSEQLARLKTEFTENRYLNEKRRQELANQLQLHENQIKIWFQNKRAKIKKTTGHKNPLALQLMAQGLYNHSTVPVDEEDAEDYLQHHENSD